MLQRLLSVRYFGHKWRNENSLIERILGLQLLMISNKKFTKM